MVGTVVGITVGTTTVWKPLSGSTSCTFGSSGVFCSGASSTTVVSIFTAVSAGRAAMVAYTAPAISTAWSASDVAPTPKRRSEEHTSELQSHLNLVCRLLLEKKKKDSIQEHHVKGI